MARPKTKRTRSSPQRNFPLWAIAIGAVLLIAAVWAMVNASQPNRAGIEVTGAPGIRVDQEVFDYGAVKLGEKPIRTVVKVTNVGDQTLRFTEAPYVEVLEGC